MPSDPSLEDLIATGGAAATSPSPTQEPDKQPAEPAQEPAAAPPADPESEPDTEPDAEPAAEDDADFIAFVKDEFGVDLSTKYKDPREAVKGLVEAHKKMGERDEDAAYGRALRQMLAGKEADLAAFLQGGEKQTAETPRKGSMREIEDFPEDADNWRNMLVQDEAGKLAPPPGATFTLADVQAYNAALSRRISSMAREWSQIKDLPNRVKEDLQAVTQNSLSERVERSIGEWEKQYKDVLYVGGNATGNEADLTPIGKHIQEINATLLQNNPSADRIECLRLATKIALGDQTGNGKAATKKVPARAVKTPGVATATSSYKNLDDEIEQRIAKGEDIAKVLTEVHQKMTAGSLG